MLILERPQTERSAHDESSATQLVVAVGAPPGRWRRRSPALRKAVRVVGPLSVLAAWYLTTRFHVVDTRFISTPGSVLHVFAGEAASGSLQSALLVSLGRVVKGLAIGIGLGVLAGSLVGVSKLIEDLLDPVFQMFRTIPFVALTSLFIVWFGIGEEPKVALVALATFFPIYLNVHNGIRNVDQRLVEAAQGFGLGRVALIREVVLPGALPQALLGLRIALGVSWLALVAAEQIDSSSGVGALLANAQNNLDSAGVIAGIVTYAMLGIATDLIVRVLERRLLAWRRGFVGA
jgi:sulfonate transport system permease protein